MKQLFSFKRQTMRLQTIGAHYYGSNTWPINVPATMDENEAELTSDH